MTNYIGNMKEFFDILGIDQTTDQQIIKEAYRKKLSPDLSGEETFRLNVAYSECQRYVHELQQEILSSHLVGNQILGVEFDENPN